MTRQLSSKSKKNRSKKRFSRSKIFKNRGKKGSLKWKKHNVRKKDFMNILKYKSKRKIFNKTSKLLLKSVRVIVQKTSRKIAKITVKTFEDLNDNKCALIVGMVPRLIVDTWILESVNFFDSSNWPFYALGWYLFVRPSAETVIDKFLMEASKLIVKVFSLIPEFKKPLKDHKKGILLAIKTFTSVILMQSDLKKAAGPSVTGTGPSVTGTDGLDWGRKAGGKMGWMTPAPPAPQPPPPKAPILGKNAKVMNKIATSTGVSKVILGTPLGWTVMIKAIFAECCISILTTYVCKGPDSLRDFISL